MKTILLLLVAAWSALAQPAYTTITDTIYTPVSGLKFTGVLQVSGQIPIGSSANTIGQWTYTIPVSNGGPVSFGLVANTTAVPATTVYVFRLIPATPANGATANLYCTVPVSATPVKINSICTSTAPGTSFVSVLLTQLANGGATSGQCLAWSGTAWAPTACGSGGGGSGTVTLVSIASANGLAGTVATATTTPAITLSTTITGLLKGNGTAISAAASGTDYVVPARTINTTAPITGGGDLSADRTLACATCGVTGTGLNQFASTTSAQLAGVLSDKTGSGAAVFATSPTLVTPALGTPASGIATNLTGLPAAGVIGTAVVQARSISTTSPISGGGDLSADRTFACATCGITGTGLGQFASTTSAQLAAVLSDETGTGLAVFGTSPTFTTPIIAALKTPPN